MRYSDVNKFIGNAKIKYAFLTILVVIVCLATFEIFLRIADVNQARYFLSKNDKVSGLIAFNPNVLCYNYRSFSTIPYNNSSEFSKTKKNNEYRVFLIGESSVAGWPYSIEQSVANKMKGNLTKLNCDKKINVIDVCFAGFNSSHAVELVAQIIEYDPDLLILYNGHNEFYGYKGITQAVNNSSFALVTLLDNLLSKSGVVDELNYNSDTDDLELLLPIYSNQQIIRYDAQNYNYIKSQFADNVLQIVDMCKDNNVALVLSVLSDNYLLPPLGVENLEESPSADLIFNNARMALLRDGDSGKARELFSKSKELDAFRLRVPNDFADIIKHIASSKNILYADLEKEFSRYSKNSIPGNDLFVDYFHPNVKGLEIIASVYTQIILKNLNVMQSSEIDISNKIINPIYLDADRKLANARIEKAFSLLDKYKTKNNDVSLIQNESANTKAGNLCQAIKNINNIEIKHND